MRSLETTRHGLTQTWTAEKRWRNIDCIEIMCNYLLHNFFGKRENLCQSNDARLSKMGDSLRGKKNYATPTNEDLGQTSNWSRLVATYLPVARLTILDRLVWRVCKRYDAYICIVQRVGAQRVYFQVGLSRCFQIVNKSWQTFVSLSFVLRC